MSVLTKRPILARLFLLTAILTTFLLAWRYFKTIPLRVLGQPQFVGLLQQDQEAAFFKRLPSITGIPLEIAYQKTDSLGLKEGYQLQALKDGWIDLASIRVTQNIRNEPSLEGLVLPGMVPDFATSRRVATAYAPTIDHYLQQSFGVKLLGLWSFGPQVMFCRRPLAGLQSLRGRTVRVPSPGLAQLIDAIGAKSAILPFEETQTALALGMIDCAVASAASANYAGWTSHGKYFYPLVLQYGFNGYVISLQKWNALTHAEQLRFQLAFRNFNDSLWGYSQALQRQSEQCITGGACAAQKPHRLTAMRVSPQDVELLRQLSRQIVLPSWTTRCERKHPGCRKLWDQHVAPIVLLNQPFSGKN